MYLSEKPSNQYPIWARIFFWLQKRKQGQVSLPLMIWGRRPWLLFSYLSYYLYLDRKGSPISQQQRSLVQTRIAHVNHCAFCSDLNEKMWLDRGVNLEKLEQLDQYDNSKLYSEEEKDLLRFADLMTISNKSTDEALVSRLKNRFGAEGLVELAGLIAFQNLSAKFNFGLDLPSQGFCKMRRNQSPL